MMNVCFKSYQKSIVVNSTTLLVENYPLFAYILKLFETYKKLQYYYYKVVIVIR